MCKFLRELAHTFFFFLLTPLENVAFFHYKRRDVLPKTTWYFTKNNVLFCHKRRVILPQTTCCFATNDVLFLWKWICVFGAAMTLVTAKKQKTCRMRACYARVYVCVARGDDRLRIIDPFCCVCVAKMWVSNLETPFFCRFFTLLPHIYPYRIGGEKIRQLIRGKVGMQITISSKMLILKRNSERKITFSTLLLRSFLEGRWKLHFKPPFFLKNCFVRMK